MNAKKKSSDWTQLIKRIHTDGLPGALQRQLIKAMLVSTIKMPDQALGTVLIRKQGLQIQLWAMQYICS